MVPPIYTLLSRPNSILLSFGNASRTCWSTRFKLTVRSFFAFFGATFGIFGADDDDWASLNIKCWFLSMAERSAASSIRESDFWTLRLDDANFARSLLRFSTFLPPLLLSQRRFLPADSDCMYVCAGGSGGKCFGSGPFVSISSLCSACNLPIVLSLTTGAGNIGTDPRKGYDHLLPESDISSSIANSRSSFRFGP